MITDEDAKKLVEDLRGIAEENKRQGRRADLGKSRCAHHNGKSIAYHLAANWLERIITNEEADNA